MIYLNKILFKYYENLGRCYILYYLDIHQKELKSIWPLFLNPGTQLLFVGRSNWATGILLIFPDIVLTFMWKKVALSVSRSLICFRSLKSLISSLNIDTGFLGFFSGLVMTLTNININFFCATTETDKPWILKCGFWPIKMHDVYIYFLRSNLILCIRLSKNLQAHTSKRGNFKYKKLSRNMKNFVYSLMNFEFLSAERDKHDFGLIEYERQRPTSISFTLSISDSWVWLWCDKHFNLLKQLPSTTGKSLSPSTTVQ